MAVLLECRAAAVAMPLVLVLFQASLFEPLGAAGAPIEDPVHRCGMECAARGFCCNNPNHGMNRLISCSQACLIRARGLDKTGCQRQCSPSLRHGCSVYVDGHQYNLCGECSDLTADPKCAHGVANAAACEQGCGIEPLTERQKKCAAECPGKVPPGDVPDCLRDCVGRAYTRTPRACALDCVRSGTWGCTGVRGLSCTNCSKLAGDSSCSCNLTRIHACISDCLV